MGAVKGAIELRDNMSAVLHNIKKEQASFRQDTAKTKKELKDTWEKKRTAKLDATTATKKMTALKKKMEPLRKKVVTAVAVKDVATAKVRAIGNKVKTVGKMVASPVVRMKDKVSPGIAQVAGKIKSIAKATVIPVTIAATAATAVLGATISSGMQLENQQVSIKHYIGATNKGMGDTAIQKVADQFTSALRDNANKTPFETGEVIEAGSRAIAVANGSTKEAMSLVTLAEDMAAASGGTKSISDAMEALADAKMGETERLKEFGFKVSAKDFESKGFQGVSKDLQGFFGGAAEKLAQTGSGLMSTIKGKLKSAVADTGLQIVEKLKPAFSSVITLIDKVSPGLEKIGVSLAERVGSGIQFVSGILPKLQAGISPLITPFMQFSSAVKSSLQQVGTSLVPVVGGIVRTVQDVLPAVLPVLGTVISTISSTISRAAPIVSGLVSGVGSVIRTLAPIFNTIFGGIGVKVGSVIDFVASKMGFIQSTFSIVAPLIGSILSTAWKVISPIMDICISTFKILFSVVKRVFPGIQQVMQGVWKVIKPIVEGVGWVVSKVAGGLGSIADKISGEDKPKKPGENAKGTNNWRGGVTWVGEQGAELVDLPRGSRILPHKESIRFAQNSPVPVSPIPAQPYSKAQTSEKIKQAVTITIAKIADSVIIREEADIDKIGAAVAKQVVQAAANMV